jgi:hypothetical protein
MVEIVKKYGLVMWKSGENIEYPIIDIKTCIILSSGNIIANGGTIKRDEV